MKFSNMKENMLALFVAFILSFGIVFLLSHSNLLKADILANNKNSENSNNIKGDIISGKEGNKFYIKSGKNIDGVSTISLHILFDPTKVSISKENINSDFDDYAISLLNDGHINLIISKVNKITEGQNLFSLGFSGSDSVINVSDVFVVYTNGEKDNLSVSSK